MPALAFRSVASPAAPPSAISPSCRFLGLQEGSRGIERASPLRCISIVRILGSGSRPCWPPRSQPRSSTARLAAAMAAASAPQVVETVWALDFDGMLCDSVGESALSAWKAAVKLWPDVFNSDEAEAKKDAVIEGMRVARPVIETGYENIPMVRGILEGIDPKEMLQNWGAMLPELMAKWGLERAEMVELFGSTRDDWIKDDLAGWLAPNRFYPGIAEATKIAFDNPECAMYIVTTKQARFTEALMRDMAGIPFPIEKIYSQTVSGKPKSEVLAMLQERHPNAKCYRFIEDKMGTLEKMATMEDMSAWELYLVDWGYNTDAERKRAAESTRISLIGLGEYQKLMQ